MANDVKHEKNKGPHRWKKGESGNPNGRPSVSKSLTEKLRKMLAQKSKFDIDMTREDKIWDTCIRQAEGGDDRARQFIMERAYGRVPDKLITRDDTDGLIIDIE